MNDQFFTIKNAENILLKVKDSKFIAFAYPVSDEAQIHDLISALKKEHYKANHHCHAYMLGPDKQLFRANDDGEPSGTAGRPILGQIEKFNLTNTLIVVVRYFGGTKLGTSGLIKAYKESAAIVIEQCTIVEQFIYAKITLTTNYELIGNVMNVINHTDCSIISVTYNEDVNIILQVRQSETDSLLKTLKSAFLSRPLDDIDVETVVEGITFSILD